MSRRYAIFDAAQLGPQLDVTRGGIVLTTLVPGLSIARTARLTVPAQDFESFAEFIVYGNAGTSIANRISIGVVTADASLSDYVGADAFGLGYRLGEGQIHHNGSSVESATVGALGDVIGVRYTPGEAGEGVVTWYRNGVQVAAVALPAELEGQPLHLACSLGSSIEPGDLGIMVNSGRDWYWHPVAGQALGWWDVPSIPGTLRYGDAPYISSRDDADPYQRWEGGITSNSISDDRGVHFWIWGSRNSQARGSAAVLEVLDSEGRLDEALGLVYRDQPASLRLVDPETGYDAGADLGAYIVERIEATDTIKRKITLKGPLAAFEIPMLRLAVRPDADPDAVGHYYPMLIGPAFSCPVRLLDKARRIYALDAVGTNAIGKVRDNGVALDISATPPDYTLLPGGREVELQNEPYGTVTVDAAGTGAGYVPPGAPDVLDGDGNPFAGDPLIGWELVDGAGASPTPNVNGHLRLWSQGGWGRIKHSTAMLTAGRSYRWSITIHNIRQYLPGGIPVVIGLDSRDSGPFSLFWQAQGRFQGQPGIMSDNLLYLYQPTTFQGIYTPTTSHAPTISWRDYAGPTPGVDAGLISNVTFIELPEPEDGGEDETDAAIAALARPLEDMLRQGIEARCGLSPDTWDAASAAAIDAATGYTGQGFWAREQIKLRDYIDALLAPYMASAFEAADGRLTFARLIDPESVDLDASPTPDNAGPDITGADILNDPMPEADEMPGLTCSIGCRRNEHVFSADELGDALPWAARPKLTNQYRYVRRYGGPLAAGLEHARASETLDSRLVIPADAQDAIDHAGQLASVPRAFFTIRVPDPKRWEVAQVCRLYLPRWFRDNGGWRNVYITRITNGRQPSGTLRVWTRAPWAQ